MIVVNKNPRCERGSINDLKTKDMSNLSHEQMEYLQPNYEDRHRIEVEQEWQATEDCGAMAEDLARQAEHQKLESSLVEPYWMPTKSNAMAAAQMVAKQVQEGFLNPLETVVRLKNVMDFCKQSVTAIEADAYRECELKYAKGETCLGATVQAKKGADNFKYDHDAEWVKLNEALKKREEEMKSAYQAQQTGKTIVDEHGEVVTPAINNPNKNSLTIKHAA